MTEIVKTMKLHIHVQDSDTRSVEHLTEQYRLACNFVSQYIFDHNFPMSSVTLSNKLYQTIRSDFGLKSQLTQSAIRTVTARYDSIRTQMKRKPYKFKGYLHQQVVPCLSHIRLVTETCSFLKATG